MFRETHTRSVAKAVSWRVMGTMATTLLVFVFTRRMVLSLAVGAFEFVSKIGLFWLHERIWDRLRYGKEEIRPVVIWFTGLSGSGKSTVSRAVGERLAARGYRLEYLDGDAIRHIFPNTGFSRPEREEHIKRVGYLASKLEQNGVFVVASFVSPYEASRQFVRGLCRRFVEVHVSTPLAVCEQRDPKGLYARARRGEIKNFTGIDDPYEPPAQPELAIDASTVPVDEAVTRVLATVDRIIARGA